MSAALAFFAAVCHGTQAVVIERGMSFRDDRQSARPALTAAIVTLVGSVVLLWTVVALSGRLVPVTVAQAAPFVAAGLADPALTRVLYYEGIDRVGPSVAAAITAGNPAVAAVVAVALLGEGLTLPELVGLVAVVVGVAWLQLVQTADHVDADSVDLLQRRLARADRRDLLYPVGTMVFVGVAAVVVEIGLDGLPNAAMASALAQTTALAAYLVLFGGSAEVRRRAGTTDFPILGVFLFAGLVLGVAWLAMFGALRTGDVVTVMPLVSTYPLFVVVLTAAVEREVPRSPRILGAVAAIVAGAALVQAG